MTQKSWHIMSLGQIRKDILDNRDIEPSTRQFLADALTRASNHAGVYWPDKETTSHVEEIHEVVSRPAQEIPKGDWVDWLEHEMVAMVAFGG